MSDYKRMTKSGGKFASSVYSLDKANFVYGKDIIESKNEGLVQQLIERLAEIEDKIENGTLKEVVKCKDCVYFQPEYVEMENKERRSYTKEEIKNGKFVSMEKGINCGSRCERFRYWNENSYPVWFNENDFCSYGKPKPKRNLKN